ncbi:colicin V synthesis protein [Methylovirgula ligni]|uniref:Membrane protein required for colicin V production n=1 Tax=Methylovirgula ligni TaxID=569860 RepID=A0A3D9YTJ5_9HYPH|nr:CvpA family protein [Methylovirgula ligni]QAY96497.1 colicin V synthesis protein [Methylovirgula ligni]REF84212.1 membrane protein required for colicin V production [Methylovirgula ligni]
MPSYLDLGVIAIVLISAALAMVRGFTREVLAIASWGAAAVAAIYFHPLVLPFVKPYISKDTVALAAAAAIVFFATLIVVSIITVKVSDAILDSKVGPLDRSLGFVFGAARGLLLCVIAFAFFNWLVPEKAQPGWVRDAKTKPLLVSTGDQLMALLPDDPEGLLNKLKKAKPTAGDEAVPDSDSDGKLTPTAPTAAPAAPGAAPAPAPNTTPPAPAPAAPAPAQAPN